MTSTGTKQVQATAKRKPPAAGKGRKKGSTNKVTRELKDMILGALDKAGGMSYLTARALDPRTAAAFMTLVGKVLPTQLTGKDGGPVMIKNAADMTDEALAAIAAGKRA